jgi:hypothetical protein
LGRFVLPGIGKPVRHDLRMMEVPNLFKSSAFPGSNCSVVRAQAG